MSLLERADWDSAFFGLEIARLQAVSDGPGTAQALREADAAGVACIYLQVDAADAAALAAAQAAGFRMVDVRIDLDRSLAGHAPARPGGIRPATAEDRDWVAELARGRFTHSRFATDPNFARDAAPRLFERWAQRGFDEAEMRVLVADDRGGFVICRTADAGWIDLIATAAGAPPGTGGRLVGAALDAFAAEGLARAAVATQASNIGALRLYERQGYRICGSAVWLHRWHPGAAEGGLSGTTEAG